MLFWKGLKCNSDEVNVKSRLIAHLPETTGSDWVLVRARWEFKHNWEACEQAKQRTGWRLGISAPAPPHVTFSVHAEPFDHCPAQGYVAAWARARDVYRGGGCCNLHMLLIHPVFLFPQTLPHITMGSITAGAPSAEMWDCPCQAQLCLPEMSLITSFRISVPVSCNLYSIFCQMHF